VARETTGKHRGEKKEKRQKGTGTKRVSERDNKDKKPHQPQTGCFLQTAGTVILKVPYLPKHCFSRLGLQYWNNIGRIFIRHVTRQSCGSKSSYGFSLHTF